MLSAFTARPILELKLRDKSRIESILLHGDRLLVGLSTGALRIYRVNESINNAHDSGNDEASQPSTTQKSLELLREQEKLSKHKLEQLAVIKEANVLISLSNAQVAAHDLADYELQETFVRAKGATSLAVTSNIVKDESTGIPEIVSRLAVAIKRKLLVWTWRDSALSDDVQEIGLATTVRSITWLTGSRLVAGLVSNYVLVDVEKSMIIDIVGPGAIGGAVGQDAGRFSGVGVTSLMGGMGPMPLATRLGEGCALLAKDINTHFIDTNGQPLKRRQIPWPQAPDAVGYSYPYLLALMTGKGTMEVRNPETLSALQVISLPHAKILHVPNPGVSLAHAGKGFLVASERCIWKMNALNYTDQIDLLVEVSKYDEAISLLGMLEDALLLDKKGRLREVKMLKAENLFKQNRYRQSLELFIDVHAPPERVIKLYPSSISGDDSNEDANQGSQEHTPGTETRGADNASSVVEPEVHSATTKAETASLATPSHNGMAQTSLDQESTSNNEDLKNAVIELISYLVETRTRIQRVIDFDGNLKDTIGFADITPENKAIMLELETRRQESEDSGDTAVSRLRDTAKLVDSTLFRSYMFARPSLAGPLFRLPNFIDAEVAEEKLMESKRYSDLIDFLYGKGLHEKALDLLERFGKGEGQDEEVPEQLRGPQRLVSYLQNLQAEHVDLILKHIDWPIHSKPDLAMEVFVADTANAENLPRTKVLNYLQGIDAKLSTNYLEHVIGELGETNAGMHQRLIELYLQALHGAEPDVREQQRNKLLTFLRTSRHYESWRVIPHLPRDHPDLYEARAVVLGRMGQHKQALEIYVFDIGNYDKAEDYCNQVWIEQHQDSSIAKSGAVTATIHPEDDTPTVYHILLSLYLTPRAPREPQLVPALDLLARHGSRLPASSTLTMLPESLAIEKLESYCKGRMRAANSTYNQARIVSGLRKTLDVDADATLRLGLGGLEGKAGRNRSVVITEGRICGVCHKRFGGSAIKVLPDNVVVHYGCTVR